MQFMTIYGIQCHSNAIKHTQYTTHLASLFIVLLTSAEPGTGGLFAKPRVLSLCLLAILP